MIVQFSLIKSKSDLCTHMLTDVCYKIILLPALFNNAKQPFYIDIYIKIYGVYFKLLHGIFLIAFGKICV